MTLKLSALALSMIILTACDQDDALRPIQDYPEAQTHSDCIFRRADQFAGLEGNVIELAYVAASGCNQTRRALALAMSNRRTFVETFTAQALETDIQLIAERIYFVRSGAA